MLDQLDTFVTDVLAPRAAEIDETAAFPQDVVAAAADIGLQRVLIGDDGRLDPTRAPLVHEISERLAMHSMASAVAIANAHLTTYLLLKYAPAELTDRWVEPTLAAQVFGAFAITEAHAGTDVRGMTTVARRDGDDYLLTGAKSWWGTPRTAPTRSSWPRRAPPSATPPWSPSSSTPRAPGSPAPRGRRSPGCGGCPTAPSPSTTSGCPRGRACRWTASAA